ncbi:MAG: ATP-grasp domain-containing protein [Myxococcales bacterium]|nr:ATP-grasp domain-containing protein [Myxococcales bacterium]
MDGLFLVLEPNNHMYMVIEAAHRRGLTVVVCHGQPVAPPAPFDQALPCISHYLPVESWKDERVAFEAIAAWCGTRPVRGTYAGFEITLRTEALLRQHYGLPGNAPERIDFLLNKARVRDALREASLTRLRTLEDDEIRKLTAWPFPGRAAFLKPSNGSGSVYVRRCTTLADVHEHLAEWDGNARQMRRCVADHLQGGAGMLLEEEAIGELLSLEGYCYDGRYVPIGINDRTVLARDVAIEMGTTFPCPHPRQGEIIERVRAIHTLLGLAHGATHTELIVDMPSGDIELVEVNLRFAGGDILVLVDRAFDIRFEDDLVNLAVGEAPRIEIPETPVCYACEQDVLAPAHVRAFESLEIPGDDVFFRKVFVKLGTALKASTFQTDQIAQFAFVADSYAAALARISAIRAGLAVNGSPLGDDPNNIVINYGERWAASS